MLDGKKYLRQLMELELTAIGCPHCGSQTISAGGKSTFCNFCEQHTDVFSAGDKDAQAAFAPVVSSMAANSLDEARKNADRLLKNNSAPRQLYLLSQFYLYFSNLKYYQRDYALQGFMEANADNISSSLDLTSRWKECYFKAIKIVEGELTKNMQVEPELVFIKFMSEMKLQKLVDAANTLVNLERLDKRGLLIEYATMVYNAEKRTQKSEPNLSKMLANKEINSFYYLAKYLAKRKKLEESEKILQKLSESTKIFVAEELLNKVRATLEASKM